MSNSNSKAEIKSSYRGDTAAAAISKKQKKQGYHPLVPTSTNNRAQILQKANLK